MFANLHLIILFLLAFSFVTTLTVLPAFVNFSSLNISKQNAIVEFDRFAATRRSEVRYILETYYLNETGEFGVAKWYKDIKHQYQMVIAIAGHKVKQRHYFHGEKIQFSMPHVANNNYNMRAMLYLYLHESPFRSSGIPYKIDIFQPRNRVNNYTFLEMGTARIRTKRKGWVIIPFHLIKTTSNILRYIVRITHPNHVGVISLRDAGFIDINTDIWKRPFLAIYFEKQPEQQNVSTTIVTTAIEQTNQCSVQPFYVNFNALGLLTVLAPLGYEAGYCSGVCKAHFRGFQYAHSYFQQIAHHISNTPDPAISCVPIKISEVEIVNVLKNDIAEAQKIFGSVQECGCE